jgi:hypothetical protein
VSGVRTVLAQPSAPVSDTCVKRGDEPSFAKVSDTTSDRQLLRMHSRTRAQARDDSPDDSHPD